MLGAEPEIAMSVFENDVHRLPVQTAGIIDIGSIVNERQIGRIQKTDSATGADPQVAFGIFENGLD